MKAVVKVATPILVFPFFLLVFDQYHIRARLLPHERQLFA